MANKVQGGGEKSKDPKRRGEKSDRNEDSGIRKRQRKEAERQTYAEGDVPPMWTPGDGSILRLIPKDN